MTLSSNMSLQSTITSCFEGIFFTVNHESQNFKAGHMLQMGQASYGGENVIYSFFLIISIDWVRPGILLQRTWIMRLEENLAQSQTIPGVGGILGSYINCESTMDCWADTGANGACLIQESGQMRRRLEAIRKHEEILKELGRN